MRLIRMLLLPALALTAVSAHADPASVASRRASGFMPTVFEQKYAHMPSGRTGCPGWDRHRPSRPCPG